MILYNKLHSTKIHSVIGFTERKKKYKNETLSDRENNDKSGVKRIIYIKKNTLITNKYTKDIENKVINHR